MTLEESIDKLHNNFVFGLAKMICEENSLYCDLEPTKNKRKNSLSNLPDIKNELEQFDKYYVQGLIDTSYDVIDTVKESEFFGDDSVLLTYLINEENKFDRYIQKLSNFTQFTQRWINNERAFTLGDKFKFFERPINSEISTIKEYIINSDFRDEKKISSNNAYSKYIIEKKTLVDIASHFSEHISQTNEKIRDSKYKKSVFSSKQKIGYREDNLIFEYYSPNTDMYKTIDKTLINEDNFYDKYFFKPTNQLYTALSKIIQSAPDRFEADSRFINIGGEKKKFLLPLFDRIEEQIYLDCAIAGDKTTRPNVLNSGYLLDIISEIKKDYIKTQKK